MKCSSTFVILFALALGLCAAPPAGAQDTILQGPAQKPLSGVKRLMENLGRGVVAINQGGGKVFVSWRLLGTDPEGIAFNLYRQTSGGVDSLTFPLNAKPITQATWFVDSNVNTSQTNAWFVRPVLNGKEQAPSKPWTLKAGAPAAPYLDIPLKTPTGYTPNDASVGDLDGDGEYEIVLHQTGRARDNAQAGVTDPPIFQAYKLDGTFLWQINLGKNIRDGAHYTQFMVYDLDGDGKAEIVMKTADGTLDGAGKVIGDPKADWVEKGTRTVPTRDRTGATTDARGNLAARLDGRILSGPEYLTVFEGATGKALATVDYVAPLGKSEIWGDAYGNRSERYLACVAYLDGKRPSVVMCRGYYARAVLAAWNWRDGKLTRVWTFDTDDGTPGNEKYRGQGNHNLSVADVDGDGCDEIVYGACCIDHNGKGLYSTGLGHGDAMHLSDLDPARPGLEVFAVHERPSQIAGAEFRDARTGELIWGRPSTKDNGRGMTADIDPRTPGCESWSSASRELISAQGKVIGPSPASANFAVWWDGTLLRNLLNGARVSRWDYQAGREATLLDAGAADIGCVSNNSTKSTPALSADILGDWREEVILRTGDNQHLGIFVSTFPTAHRFYTLMHDPVYRLAIAWQNVAYNQPPHVGFYLGDGMAPPPRPNIVTSLKDLE